MLMLVYNMPVDRVQATRPRLKAANCLQNWCTAASICTECCIAVCAATAADFRFPKPNAPLRSASRERTKNPPWRGQGGFENLLVPGGLHHSPPHRLEDEQGERHHHEVHQGGDDEDHVPAACRRLDHVGHRHEEG